jgi:polyisoprenoid-binding protein YceI
MLKKVITVIAVVVLLGVGVLAYLFLRTPEEASTPVEAVPVVVEEITQAEADTPVVSEEVESEAAVESESTTEETPVEEAVTASEPETTTEAVAAAAAEEPADKAETVAEADTATAPQESEAEAVPASDPTVFEITPAQAEVRFVLGEILRGEPFTVVGTTDQVAAEFVVNAMDLSTAEIGPVTVNARTLATDSSFRDRAIKNQILSTDQYEFITFTPTAITGLSGPGAVGESYDFQIAGDLTIRDVTQPVTFEATATALSESEVQAIATTTILRSDYNLTIPQVSQVAGVDEEVILEIEFVATPKSEAGQG